jgi:hypothetical protein
MIDEKFLAARIINKYGGKIRAVVMLQMATRNRF